MITAEAPGKLYIAGEYAVVNHGYPAVLVAVNRFIRVTIEVTEDEGTIISRQYAHLPLRWRRVGHRLVIEKLDNPYHFILEAIHITERYALEMGRELKVYDLKVDSQLDSEEGAKYGLGSSAAVTIATVRALMRLYGLPEDDYRIYKLASLAHLKLGSNGSFGDLAASVRTGWTHYQSFDREWVLERWEEMRLTDLLKLKWPSLLIERLDPLTDYDLIVGWTRRPASTFRLVNKVQQRADHDAYQAFLENSRACVSELILGIQANDGEKVSAMIRRNRELLRGLDASIETPALTKLIEIAEACGAAKTSGAGGGDCGIVLVPRDCDIQRMERIWQENGIERLNLEVYDKHTEMEDEV